MASQVPQAPMTFTAATIVGTPEGLLFELSWPTSSGGEIAEERDGSLAWGRLTLRIRGKSIWMQGSQLQAGAVWWTWVDMIEHLAHCWRYLAHEQGPPMGVVPSSISSIATEYVLRECGLVPTKRVRKEMEAFLFRHDLAAGLHGVYLPSVLLLREGSDVRVESTGVNVILSWESVQLTLLTLVEALVARVSTRPHPRAVAAMKLWAHRHPTEDVATAIRLGLTVTEAREFIVANNARMWEDHEETPYLAAARLTTGLSLGARHAVLTSIGSFPARETKVLDELSVRAAEVLRLFEDSPPYQQGYALAHWLRHSLAKPNGNFDPESLLDSWNVDVAELPATPPELDAVAVWGKRSGPAILVNPSGTHAQSRAGRRATLAHEICHLLVDRGHALPAAEVLGGTTPLRLEQRARAFAAELLLPRDEAAEVLVRERKLAAAAEVFGREYGVSREVIGWQIKNGAGWRLLSLSEQRTVRAWLKSWPPAVLSGSLSV